MRSAGYRWNQRWPPCALGRAVPRDGQGLVAPAGKRDEVLLQRREPERVGDLVVVQLAVRAVRAHDELPVPLREGRRDARVRERRVVEVAQHGASRWPRPSRGHGATGATPSSAPRGTACRPARRRKWRVPPSPRPGRRRSCLARSWPCRAARGKTPAAIPQTAATVAMTRGVPVSRITRSILNRRRPRRDRNRARRSPGSISRLTPGRPWVQTQNWRDA